jgi:hypothetical protein
MKCLLSTSVTGIIQVRRNHGRLMQDGSSRHSFVQGSEPFETAAYLVAALVIYFQQELACCLWTMAAELFK